METETTPVLEAPETTETQAVETPVAETQTQEVTQPAAFDPNSLPKEAQEYFAKKYEGYDNHKQAAQEYERVLRNPDFQEWYRGKNQPAKAPEPEAKFELTDDEYVAALANKDKFAEIVQKAAQHIAKKELGPQLQETKREIAFSKRKTELETTITKYPDFLELDKRGLIEPELARYPNLGFEDAYWLAKRHTFAEEVDKKARGVVQTKKVASVERPNNPNGARQNKVKVSSREEAMNVIADALAKGQEPPEIDY